jgi:hypothetical protein
VSGEKSSPLFESRDWRDRLSKSRDLGNGFAAPGGEFTKALYEWSFTPRGKILHSLLEERRVVELGAGMMSYGYALAQSCGARNFVAVEPFYADIQRASILSHLEKSNNIHNRIPFKVIELGMLEYLEGEADNLLCILACGIEDCILPGPHYRKKVEQEIVRTMDDDSFFLSSHSDLYPHELKVVEQLFFRQSNRNVTERLRLHGGIKAFDKYGELLASTLL